MYALPQPSELMLTVKNRVATLKLQYPKARVFVTHDDAGEYLIVTDTKGLIDLAEEYYGERASKRQQHDFDY